MQRSSFDFDVISGPVEPRPIPKPAPKPASEKPAAEPEAGAPVAAIPRSGY